MAEYTEIIYDKEGREQLLTGIKKLAKAVKSTLGCNGETVLIKKKNKLVVYTKDGVTVADNIKLENPNEDIGRQLITEVAYKTDIQAGDGTTTSIVLTEAIVNEGMKIIDSNSNAIKKGMNKTLDRIITEIENISIPIQGNLKKMIEIATISANGDKEIGKLVANTIYDVGEDGKVDIIPTNQYSSSVEKVDGMSYNHSSYFSPYLAQNQRTQESFIENPYIVIFDYKVQKFSDMINLLSILAAKGNPIVLMMTDVSSNVLKTVIKNKIEMGMDITILKNPRETGMIEDLSLYVDADVINDDTLKLADAGLDNVGTCKSITIANNLITFEKETPKSNKLLEHINWLKQSIADDKTDNEHKELYQIRLAKLNGGIAKINVGGKTDVEMIELRDRIVDSYHSTKSAIEDGVLSGGGFALLRIREKLLKDKQFLKMFSDDEIIGFKIIIKALKQPAKQILLNGSFESEVILNNVLKHKNINYGFDSMKEQYCDLLEAGIIDSARNTKIALTNAISVAELIITTNCIVRDI